MTETYSRLSEKERRIYAAVEAQKLPHGGVTYISDLFKCSRRTIYIGMNDLNNPKVVDDNRIRKPGGGRKEAIDTVPNINEVFMEVTDEHIAGDPMDSNIKWTNLSHKKIAEKMEKKGIRISVTVVKKLLRKNGFKKRKALKSKAIGSNKDRDKQFKKISELKAEYNESDNPILSIDTKKKNCQGICTGKGKSVVRTQLKCLIMIFLILQTELSYRIQYMTARITRHL